MNPSVQVPFRCVRCGAQTTALVEAMRHEHAAAALANAACPACGGLHPSTLNQVARATRQIERAKKLRVPFAIGAAMLAALITGALGVRDLAETKAGVVFAIGATLFAAAGTLAIFLWPAAAQRLSSGVWFWWNGDYRPAPPPVEVTAPVLPGIGIRASAVTVAAVGFITAMSGLVSWLDTVTSVTVVFDDPTAVTLTVDGVAKKIPNHPATSHDVRFYGFSVRTGHVHRVELTANGTTRAFDIDATYKAHGYVIAATARPVCFAEQMAVYGSSSVEPELNVLRADANGVVALPRTYDRTFTAPPPLAKTSHGSATKWALRATTCDAIASSDPTIVPYREGTATTGATLAR